MTAPASAELSRHRDQLFEKRRQAALDLTRAQDEYSASYARVDIAAAEYPPVFLARMERAKAAIVKSKSALQALDKDLADIDAGMGLLPLAEDPLALHREARPDLIYFAKNALLFKDQAIEHLRQAAEFLREAQREETCLSKAIGTARAHRTLSAPVSAQRVGMAIAGLFEANPDNPGEQGRVVLLDVAERRGVGDRRELHVVLDELYASLIAEAQLEPDAAA